MIHGGAAQAELSGSGPGITTQNIQSRRYLSGGNSNPGPATTVDRWRQHDGVRRAPDPIPSGRGGAGFGRGTSQEPMPQCTSASFSRVRSCRRALARSAQRNLRAPGGSGLRGTKKYGDSPGFWHLPERSSSKRSVASVFHHGRSRSNSNALARARSCAMPISRNMASASPRYLLASSARCHARSKRA